MSNKPQFELRQIPVFATLEEADSLLLTKFTKSKKFPQGTSLLKSGQICAHVYLLLDCRVKRIGSNQDDQILQGGEAIGVIEVLKGQPMDADYYVEAEGSALVIPATALEEILLLSPSLATSILQGLQ